MYTLLLSSAWPDEVKADGDMVSVVGPRLSGAQAAQLKKLQLQMRLGPHASKAC